MHSNKVLITGATGGLGRYLSEYFLKKKHSIILSSRSESKLIDLKKYFEKYESSVEYFKCNLLIIQEILDLSEFCIENGIKVLINNAGIICPNKSLSKYSIEEIQRMIRVNLEAPIILSNLLKSYLSDIININSINGIEHKKYRTIYSASKWGLRGFSESLKKETDNINILDVYSSNIRTWQSRKESMDPEKVISKIYNSFIKGEPSLIIDGRPNK